MANRQTALALVFGDAVSDVGTVKLYPLGTRREEEGKVYRYVKYDNGTGNLAAVVNRLCYHTDGDWTVTMDVSDADASAACGVFQSIIADAGFGWVLSKGRVSALKTDAADDIVEGDFLIPAATADGTCRRAPLTAGGVTGAEARAALERIVGYALAADVDLDDTVDAMIALE